MEKITPYNPFPYGFRCDTLYGRKQSYCEIELGNGFTRFIVIHSKPYRSDKEREDQLIADGYSTMESFYPEIERLGYTPDENIIFWLYNVFVDDIETIYLEDSDSEVYAEHAINCKLFCFDDFYKCMDFLKEEYSVEPEDFRPQWDTNYPRY
ncbi:hypothetical protein [Leminorella grimontii]|uniref:hypothetical protein n=1 Tax=Leminorella grimontii TaxID=82981 RepID=UPI003220678D